MAAQMPENLKHYILHSTLRSGAILLMATDMVGEQGLVQGNAISILVECQNEVEIYQLYQRLANGGQATHPVEQSFWGALFGGLTDRFGNCWLLHCSRTQMNRS